MNSENETLVLLVAVSADRCRDVIRAVPDLPVLWAPEWASAQRLVDGFHPRRPEDSITMLGDVELEPRARKVAARGVRIALSEREFDLLQALCGDIERAWAFSELYETVWGAPYLGDATAVRSAVKRITHKFLDAGFSHRLKASAGMDSAPSPATAPAGIHRPISIRNRSHTAPSSPLSSPP